MKIALLTRHLGRRHGGAEGYVVDLAAGLAARGHDVTVLAQEGVEGDLEEARARGYACRWVGMPAGRGGPGGRWGRTRDFLRRLDVAVGGGDFDVVHAMLPVLRCDVYQAHAGFAADTWRHGHEKYAGAWRRWRARVGNLVNAKRRGMARVEGAMMARSRPVVLCLTEAQRAYARRAYGMAPERVPVVPYGVDLEAFDPATVREEREVVRARWGVGAEAVAALLLGNDFRRKGVAEALEALARVNDARLVLVVAGRDEAGPFRRLARRLGVEERVIFAGAAERPQALYAAADFLALPTRSDPCSLVVLEALAMGLPAVTTWQNGASERMEDGVTGQLVERGDVAGLARALGAMLDATRRRAMARAALARRGDLDLTRHVERVEAMYGAVAGRPAGMPALAAR